MKKKALATLTIVIVATISFAGGRFTAPTKTETVTKVIVENAQPTYETYIELMGHIVDWNTDGEELAIITDDDYEFYAYKSQDIYTNRLFVPIPDTTK